MNFTAENSRAEISTGQTLRWWKCWVRLGGCSGGCLDAGRIWWRSWLGSFSGDLSGGFAPRGGPGPPAAPPPRRLLVRQLQGPPVSVRPAVRAAGGHPVLSRTGHAFIKDAMREQDAVYGGEMSAHHYFRDFAYCDSGMIPWLLVASLVQRTGEPLSALVEERQAAFPCSGEINRAVADLPKVLACAKLTYSKDALVVERRPVDGEVALAGLRAEDLDVAGLHPRQLRGEVNRGAEGA